MARRNRGHRARQDGHPRPPRRRPGHVRGGRGGRYTEGPNEGYGTTEPPVSGTPQPGTGGGGTPTPPGWSFFPGMPADLSQKVSEMIAGGSTNEEVKAFLRTTPWYKQEYAGIEYGLASGQFDATGNPELQYREYKGQVNNIMHQYYGRGATGLDIQTYLQGGYNVNQLDQWGQAHTDLAAHQGQYQGLAGAYGGGLLTQQELEAYTRQKAGYRTDLGAKIQEKLEGAMNKIERAFSATASSNLSLDQSLGETVRRQRTGDYGF